MIKRIIYILAAGIVMAACDKAEIQDNSGNQTSGTPFVEGQLVTLSVNAGDQTKVTSTYSGGIASFKWETGDQIKVTVGDKSATFTLSNLIDGGTSAEFKGMMPASGSTFDVQYPTTAPDLTTQTYVESNLPEDKMLFAATNCTLGSNLTLSPQYSALRLNFYGYEREITQIAVTNTTGSGTYTLSCSTAVQVGEDSEHATSFFVVVPTGTYSFRVLLTSNDIADAVGPIVPYQTYGVGTKITASRIGTTSSKSLSAGIITSMPITKITTIWAPVNCGYDPINYPKGVLYQWGRQYGQAYEMGTLGLTSMKKADDTEAYKDKFGKHNDTDYNWFSGGVDDTLWNGSPKGTKDPCPAGWRVPTKFELDILAGGEGTGTEISGNSGWDSNNKGSWYDGTVSPIVGTGVFLPANGFREYNSHGGVSDLNNYGYYWSSSSNGNPIWRLRFITDTETDVRGTGTRARGYSVRCVKIDGKTIEGGSINDLTNEDETW